MIKFYDDSYAFEWDLLCDTIDMNNTKVYKFECDLIIAKQNKPNEYYIKDIISQYEELNECMVNVRMRISSFVLLISPMTNTSMTILLLNEQSIVNDIGAELDRRFAPLLSKTRSVNARFKHDIEIYGKNLWKNTNFRGNIKR